MTLFWLLGCLLLCACPAPPPSAEESPADGAAERAPDLRCYEVTRGQPLIELFTYKGQKEQAPRTLRLSLRWYDLEGDLAGGRYQLWRDGEGLGWKDLPSQGVAGRTRGELDLTLTLPPGPLPTGNLLHLEAQLQDKKGRTSNRPLIVLKVLR